MKINQEKFMISDFEKNKTDKYVLGNKMLYELCKKYSTHDNSDNIHAKIWLIGRSYSASIERRSKEWVKKDINDDFYDKVVNEFILFNKREKFDEELNKLKNKEFNKEILSEVLILHKKLTSFFHDLTGKEKRSLASKYLHFHVPLVFPIYDSRANNSINKIVRGRFSKIEGDKEYSKFCCKMLFLYNFIKEQTGKKPTLREIDIYLIRVANGKLSKRYGLN